MEERDNFYRRGPRRQENWRRGAREEGSNSRGRGRGRNGPFNGHQQPQQNGPNHGGNQRHNQRNNVEAHDEDNDDINSEQWKKYPMGFRTLQEIANAEGPDILTKVHEKSNSFANLLETNIDRHDTFVLIMRIISKVCSSSFEELKLKFLLNVCNSKLITNLMSYLMQLHYTPEHNKKKNNMYWANPNSFWIDFICFCDCIIMRSPSTALQKCRSLIDGASKCCLDGLRDRFNYRLPQELEIKLIELRSKLVVCEQVEENRAQRKPYFDAEQVGEPPENFRQMSILPTRDDLINDRPFLRPNIVQGRYRDIEHYLDVVPPQP